MKTNLMSRLKAFVMYLIYFVVPTDFYLRLNGYDPEELTGRFKDLGTQVPK